MRKPQPDQVAEDLANLWCSYEIFAEAGACCVIAVLAVMQAQIHVSCDRDRPGRPDHCLDAVFERVHARDVTLGFFSAFQTRNAPPTHMGSDRI